MGEARKEKEGVPSERGSREEGRKERMAGWTDTPTGERTDGRREGRKNMFVFRR